MSPGPPIVRLNNPIHLPRSSGRGYSYRYFCHLKLVTRVRLAGSGYGTDFEGRLLKPGAVVEAELLGEHPVIIECAGPQGEFRRGRRREYLWILWVLDWQTKTWSEAARSLAINFEWVVVLREPAWQALNPRPAVVDIQQRSQELAERLLREIDQVLDAEEKAVRISVLNSVYDRVAGRIVAA